MVCLLFAVNAQSQSTEDNDSNNSIDNNAGSQSINETDLGFNFSDSNSNNTSSAVQVFGIADFLRMVLVLAFVVGIIYACYFFLKRTKKLQEDESNFISLLSSQTLPGGKQLYIVDVGGQVYLLGAGDTGVSLITEITDKPTVDALRVQSEQQQSNPKSFSQLMSTFLLRGSKKQDEESPFDFIQQQRKNLRRL